MTFPQNSDHFFPMVPKHDPTMTYPTDVTDDNIVVGTCPECEGAGMVQFIEDEDGKRTRPVHAGPEWTTQGPEIIGSYVMDTHFGTFAIRVDEQGYVYPLADGVEWTDHVNDLQGETVFWYGPLPTRDSTKDNKKHE